MSSGGFKRLCTEHIMELVLLVLCVVLAFSAEGFMSRDNLLLVLRSISMQGIIAFGMTLVIISREIDLSVGSAVAFFGCLVALLLKAAVPLPLALLITLAGGAALGAFTGFMRIRFQVPSFITTLALYTVLKGGALMLTGGFPIIITYPGFGRLGNGYVLGVPFPAIVLMVMFVIVHFLMKHTTFGRAVYAVGGNPEAARLSGIAVGRVRVIVFAMTGMFAALAGVMAASRIVSGSPKMGEGWELDVIAAVIIGGTSLQGGAGRVRGTLIGMLFIGVIVNGMTLLNVSSHWQLVVRGGLILAAVLVNQLNALKLREQS